MKTERTSDIEVTQSSGNVFADLALADADRLKIKSGLVIEIRKSIRAKKLTQKEAAKLMKTTQPRISAILKGDFANISEYKLMEFLKCLQ